MALRYPDALNIMTKLRFDAVSAYALPDGVSEAGSPFTQQVATAETFWNSALKQGNTEREIVMNNIYIYRS